MFKGCCTALVTPFDKENNVDYKEFAKIIEEQIKQGVSALLFLGTTGESPTLTEQESVKIIDFAVKTVRQRVPVLAGAGTNDTIRTITVAQKYKDLGVDGLVVVTPYYNKGTQEGLFQHYKMIAGNVNCPIYLYNVPGRTGINLKPDTIARLSKIKNIVGLKQACSDLNELMEIMSKVGDDFSVYSGEDALTYVMMSVGAKGVISVASNLMPEYMSQLCEKYFAGQTKESLIMQLKINPLIKQLFSEVNPVPIKHAMNYVGYNVGKPRLPLTEMQEQKNLEKEIDKLLT